MSTVDTSILQKLITDLVGQGVGELILRAGSQPIVRRAGELEVLTQEQVISPDFLESALAFFLTAPARAKLQEQHQLTFGFTFGGRLRLRVTIFYQQGLTVIYVRSIYDSYICSGRGSGGNPYY